MFKAIRTFVIFLCLAGAASAQGDDFHTLMMRATVKLSHDRSTAAGFVLRQSRPDTEPRSILVTAAHVLEKMSGDEAKLVYRIREAEGVYKKETLKLAIRKESQPLWTRHTTEDVAVMVVALPENSDLPDVSVDLLASDDLLRQHKVHPGQSVMSLGYPHRTEANDAGFPILRTGAIASYPLVPAKTNKTFLLNANTFEGDSGGPIYMTEAHAVAASQQQDDAKSNEVRLILGLMHGQHFLDEEMVMIYGTSKLRHRLGLGIVVQAAFIRETLDRLP